MRIYPSALQKRGLIKSRGTVLIQFALLLAVLISILGTAQIGYMYYAKRDLQRIADLAALEAISALVDPSTCTAAEAAGMNSIASQWKWPTGVSPAPLQQSVRCLKWSRDAGPAFGAAPFNAAQVRLRGKSLQLLPFLGNREIYAESISAIPDDPIAAFSLGSGVAKLDEGALNRLLTMLLGTNVNLTLVDYQGLANTKVNLLGLKEALNISAGTYEELLNADVLLTKLLESSISVIQNSPGSDTANIAIAALDKLLKLPIAVNIQNTVISLLKAPGQNGLLDIGLFKDNPMSALIADVSALSLLMVGLQVANADSAATLQTGIDLKPLADVAIKAKIIEPPVIAVGPPGYDSTGKPRTTAHTGQIRTFLDIKALTPVAGKSSLLDLNLLLASVKVSMPAGQLVNLPLYVEVGSADGRLEEVICRYEGNKHRVRIDARPGLAHVFLGNVPAALTNTTTPWESLTKEKFHLLSLKLDIKLLLGLIPVVEAPIALKAKLDLPVNAPGAYSSLYYDYEKGKPRTEQALIKSVGMKQQLGQSIGNAINAGLLEVELDTSGLKLLGLDLGLVSSIVDGLVNGLVGIVSGVLGLLNVVLMPVLALLDGVLLGPLLEALGIQVGYADVELLWADCNYGVIVQ